MKAFSWIGSLFEKKTHNNLNPTTTAMLISLFLPPLFQSRISRAPVLMPLTMAELCRARSSCCSGATRAGWTVAEPRGRLASARGVGAPACPVPARQFNKAPLQQSNWALTALRVFSPRVSSVLSADKYLRLLLTLFHPGHSVVIAKCYCCWKSGE